MVVMLRRGAPLAPRVTIALGALAVAAVGNFGLRLFHLGDASIMVLFWHFGTITLLSAFAACLGPQVLYWNHVMANRA
jgi:tetrahydromethanopterin S-methyltransferase subunit C